MKTKPLGRTALQVSEICLGTMTYGEQNTEHEGHEQLDYAFSRGVNFVDTAELYAIPPKAETQGRTEEIIGTWMKARRNRAQVILATKIVGRTGMTWFRDGGKPADLSRAQVLEAVDKSLQRLQTDYIDLYQLHWPDREVSMFGANPTISTLTSGARQNEIGFEETFAALGECQKAGKIRYVGLSNESSWGAMRALDCARDNPALRVASIQNAYSLLNRTYEVNMAELSLREAAGLLAYSPLGQGFLTGKYQNGALPPGSRKALFNRSQRYETPHASAAIDAYLAVARAHGLSPVNLALAFVATRPFVTSTIIGATTMDQLRAAIDAFTQPWSADLEKAVNEVHLRYCNPCP